MAISIASSHRAQVKVKCRRLKMLRLRHHIHASIEKYMPGINRDIHKRIRHRQTSVIRRNKYAPRLCMEPPPIRANLLQAGVARRRWRSKHHRMTTYHQLVVAARLAMEHRPNDADCEIARS